LFLLLSLKELDIKILLPVLADSSFLDVNFGGILTAGYFSEVWSFWFLPLSSNRVQA
jgi:hypothetical protein